MEPAIRAIHTLSPYGRQGAVSDLIDALRWASIEVRNGGDLYGVTRTVHRLPKPFMVWTHHEGFHWSDGWATTYLALNGEIILAVEHENQCRSATLVADLHSAQQAWEAHKAHRAAAGRARSERNARIVDAIARGDGDKVSLGHWTEGCGGVWNQATRSFEPRFMMGFDGDVEVSIEGFQEFGALVAPARGSSILRALEARGALRLTTAEKAVVTSPGEPRDDARQGVILGALRRAVAEGKALRDPAPRLPARQRRAGNIDWEMCAY